MTHSQNSLCTAYSSPVLTTLYNPLHNALVMSLDHGSCGLSGPYRMTAPSLPAHTTGQARDEASARCVEDTGRAGETARKTEASAGVRGSVCPKYLGSSFPRLLSDRWDKKDTLFGLHGNNNRSPETKKRKESYATKQPGSNTMAQILTNIILRSSRSHQGGTWPVYCVFEV